MKIGLILLNMGGATSLDEVELFLRNMFNDKNILPLSSPLRRVIGSRIVKKRLHEAQENYKKLGGKSPLLEISQSLAKKIEERLKTPVRLVMRYLPPFATDALEEFKKMGVEKIILFPMYPHYSFTTTLSSVEDIETTLASLNYKPELKVVEPYFDNYDYVAIQQRLIAEKISAEKAKDYHLILSAHGLPMSIIYAGDPYEVQVNSNASALKIYLKERGFDFAKVSLAYQSKVGGGRWLEPNLADILREPERLKVVIFPLSFTVDNSETLFELSIEHAEITQKIGYEDYLVSSCPNDRDDFVDFIVSKVEADLKKSNG